MALSSAGEPAPEQPDLLDASEFTAQISALAVLKEPLRRDAVVRAWSSRSGMASGRGCCAPRSSQGTTIPTSSAA
jgi:hypothetical protein